VVAMGVVLAPVPKSAEQLFGLLAWIYQQLRGRGPLGVPMWAIILDVLCLSVG
jgi:hypothetical protein